MSVGTVHTSSRVAGRRRDLLELWIGYALILIVIWTPRPWQRIIYFVAASFIITATVLSFPGMKAIGLRAANFSRSFWLVGAAVIGAIVAATVANRIHTLHTPGGPKMYLHRFAGYIIFACVQQFLLQDFFLLRLMRIMRRPSSAVFAAAAIFSLAHLPNPILTAVTFVWGVAACFFFLHYRNLYPLAIAHAILGVTLAICVPGPVIRNMRVGLGYLNYPAHYIRHRNH